MSKVVPPVQDKDTSRRTGRDALDRPLAKRFYKEVSFSEKDGLCCVELDGRPVRTPSRSRLAASSRQLMECICQEWRAQRQWIEPDSMPLTRLANTVIDGVSIHMDDVRQAIIAFAGSDLLCYRAERPAELAQKQAEAWDPVLEWVQARYGARFETGAGIAHVAQPRESIDALDRYLADLSAFELAPLHVMTSLTGSLFLALAVAEGRLDVDQAWCAAHVDEDWQIALWGEDKEAQTRRGRRLEELRSAARFLELVRA